MMRDQDEAKTMYEELDEYLSGPFSTDYWYDEGVIFATETLRKFDKSDWEKLLCYILSKPRDWQIRFAYSTADINNEYVLECLILLSGIEEDELFETCIDSLRVLLNSDSISKISEDKAIKQRVERIMQKCDSITRKMFEDFISKLKR